MKHSHIMQSMLLSVLLFGSPIQSEINTPEESSLSASEAAQLAEITEFAKETVVKAFTALQRIENKLTEVALLVKKGLFKGISIDAVMNVLTENKMTINALLQSQAAVTSLKDPFQHLEIAFVVSEFCNAFIPYLDQQIKNNFKNPVPFDLNRFLQTVHTGKTRSNSHLEPSSLMKGLKTTNSHLRTLKTTVQNIGLTWYNKAARSVDKWVVTPANKWNVPTIAAYGTGMGLLGCYTLWSYGHMFMDNQSTPTVLKDSINKLHNMFGKPILRNRGGNPKLLNPEDKDRINQKYGHEKVTTYDDDKIPTEAGIFATTDYAVKEFLLQSQPLGALAAGFMFASLAKTIKEDMYPRFIKKRDAWWNFLRGGEYLNSFQPGLVAIKPTVSFKDMVGLDEVKESFYSILQYIENPEQLMRIEATPEKGWLLTGPPRTGKTFSVECLCGEIELMMAKRGQANKMKFFNINASLVNEFGIKAILDEVYENAPAVIFIDEIDLLGLQRVGNNKLLSDFLTAMQSSMNADPAKVVIVIAATNKPENIDSALRSNGRFGKEIRFDYPSRKYRSKFIVRELANMALNVKEFDIETLADKTNDKTFEDLKRVIRNAMTRSWMHGTSLTQELLEESIDTELHNIIMFDRKELPENERRIVATHFAGMALAALHLETTTKLDKVTTHAYMADLKDEAAWESLSKKKRDEYVEQKKIEYGKFIAKQSHDTINAKGQELILNEATLLLAGFAAEELLLGPCGFSCHPSDHDKAHKLIQKLVFGGISIDTLPKNVREELKTKAYNMLKKCHENAVTILNSNRDELTAIIEELLKKQILSDKDIQTIIKNVQNPPTITENDTQNTAPAHEAVA